MVRRTLAQINQEINYATTCWHRLTLKTIPYRARMEALEKEKTELLNMSEKQLAKIEREKVVRKESEIKGYLRDPNTGRNNAQPTIIDDRSDDTRW
jgi:hypothetical protein